MGELASTLLRALVDQVHDLVALTDAIGTLSWANPSFAVATGFVPGTLATSLLAFAPAGPAGTQTRLALAEMLAAPAREGKDIELRGENGAILWVDARVQQFEGQLLWTFRDVTAAHLLEQLALHQGELLATAQQFGRLGIWDREIPSGEGHWDAAIFSFWGIDSGQGTPNYLQAI